MNTFYKFLKEQILLEKNLEDFIEFAVKHLDLEHKPKISLLNSREEHMTNANYCTKSKEIKIYTKKRAFSDIARSLAHELVHHKQNERGDHMDGDTGSDCENEANTVAGKIVRLYGKENPNFYDN